MDLIPPSLLTGRNTNSVVDFSIRRLFANLPEFSSYTLCAYNLFVFVFLLFSSDIINCTLTLFLICETPPSREDSIFSGEFTRAHYVNFFKASQSLWSSA